MSDVELVGPGFLNDGGPMLVLSAHQLDDWLGSPLGAEDVLTGDYGRACEIEESTGLDIASGTAIVVACDDLYYPMHWLRHGTDWIVAGWSHSEEDSEERLLAALRSEHPVEWKRVAERLPVRGGLALVHAASSGDEFDLPASPQANTVTLIRLAQAAEQRTRADACIGDALLAHVQDGQYDLCYAYVELDDDNACALWRWSPR